MLNDARHFFATRAKQAMFFLKKKIIHKSVLNPYRLRMVHSSLEISLLVQVSCSVVLEKVLILRPYRYLKRLYNGLFAL